MTGFKHILYEKSDTIARVKLNRPKYRNAQSQLMLEEMDTAFHSAVEDRDVRAIILSGEGEHFSSGHDLGTQEESEDQLTRGYPSGPSGVYEKFDKIYLEYGLRWRDLPKPTIAMVQGYCIFGGWQIASAMDLIVAAEDTKFLPGFVEYFSLPWDIGYRKAKEVLFQSRFVEAEEALTLGFVNRVVPRDKLESETLAFAKKIAEAEPFLTRMTKLSLNQAQDAMGFRLAVQAALANFVLLAHSGDILSAEDMAAGKRSLSPVDRALANLKEEKDKK
ncbi:MAG: enoyl-CoA hydratase/isomerase family protein [Deltaproteobacteria bacterium]|nr:enoyl-CoA hydratase/isomerase family protein [Deltaproteobacteria bacterium]